MRNILTFIVIIAFCVAFGFSSIRQASVYAERYNGRKTASGEVYRHWQISCASNQHKLGTKVTVTATGGKYKGNTVVCKVNDRLAKRMSHRIDLSGGAMKKLTNGDYKGDKNAGVVPVTVKQ